MTEIPVTVINGLLVIALRKLTSNFQKYLKREVCRQLSFKTLCPSCKQDGKFHNLVLKPMENCCPAVSWQGAAFLGNFPSSPYLKRIQGIGLLASSLVFVVNSGSISQSCLQLPKTPLHVPALFQFIKEETGSSDALQEPRSIVYVYYVYVY